jgi:hypothetical protein
MKPLLYLSFALLAAVFIISACTKTVIHDRRRNVTDSPESREFFAVLVNGKGFVSEAATNNVSGYCTYTPTYKGKAGNTFKIFSDYRVNDCSSITVGIVLDSVELKPGATYSLGTPGEKKFSGTYLNSPCSQSRIDLFTSDAVTPAYITIKRIDTVKHVVTGIFTFVVEDQFGTQYQISDGTFDRHYTF